MSSGEFSAKMGIFRGFCALKLGVSKVDISSRAGLLFRHSILDGGAGEHLKYWGEALGDQKPHISDVFYRFKIQGIGNIPFTQLLLKSEVLFAWMLETWKTLETLLKLDEKSEHFDVGSTQGSAPPGAWVKVVAATLGQGPGPELSSFHSLSE